MTPDGLPPVIKLQDLTKVFSTEEVETHALSNVTVEIGRGEYVSIAGPSGCGKSTLLSILGLLDSPTQGSYELSGRPVAELRASERARVRNREIGFIFQSFNLIGDLTVFENVELPLTYRGMSPKERRQRVTEALERVGMAHRAKHLPSQLSGGQQQRVAVARAVGGEPVILLAHEPDYASNVAAHGGVDLMLSGHTHGGQVRLPFIGTPWYMLPTGGRRFIEGYFKLGPLQLYVNRGIGTVKLPVRFLCPPELTLITLQPAES